MKYVLKKLDSSSCLIVKSIKSLETLFEQIHLLQCLSKWELLRYNNTTIDNIELFSPFAVRLFLIYYWTKLINYWSVPRQNFTTSVSTSIFSSVFELLSLLHPYTSASLISGGIWGLLTYGNEVGLHCFMLLTSSTSFDAKTDTTESCENNSSTLLSNMWFIPAV